MLLTSLQDSRFNREIDVKTGYKTRSILSMPIKDTEGHVIGVAQAVNKLGEKEEPFDERDEKVFASFLAFCGIGIRNAQLYERSVLENRRNQLLLDLARLIFEEQRDVATLIHKIMMHTQSLLRCERCQVLLIDDESSVSIIIIILTFIDRKSPLIRFRTLFSTSFILLILHFYTYYYSLHTPYTFLLSLNYYVS